MALVSVILTVLNGEQYLRQCLDSVFSQTHKELELIAVDDGSSDRTGEILGEYGGGKRVKIITHPSNMGVFKSLNEALDHARGEYIAFIAHDDWWVPEKLEVELEYLKDAGFGVVYSDFYRVDGDEMAETSLPEYDPETLKKRYYVNISSCLIRRSCLDRLVEEHKYCFDDSLVSGGDSDFWIRLTGICNFKHIPKPLSYYRIHPKQLSKTLVHQRDRIRVYRKHNKSILNLPLDLYVNPLGRILKRRLSKK
jgi:glycosyltransferase involved in cell wall biosynthesis